MLLLEYEIWSVAVLGITSLLVVTILLTSINQAFADGGYEKSQVISQANECGNYWFPVNIIWSNLNSQAQGDENDVAMATKTPDSKYGAPFP